MKKLTQAEKHQASLVKRFGSPEAVTAWRSKIARKGGSRKVPKGFSKDPEFAREAGRMGAIAANEKRKGGKL